MSNAYFYFDGRKSTEFNCFIRDIKREMPQKDIERIKSYGKKGQFLFDAKTAENIKISYAVTLEPVEDRTVEEMIFEFTRWLESDGMFKKMYDSQLTDYYYKGIMVDNIIFDTQYYGFAEAVVNFECLPKVFLFNGEHKMILLKNENKIMNKYSDSEPRLEFETVGKARIVINKQEIVVNRAGKFFIDSESMTDNGDYNDLGFDYYPILKKGVNVINKSLEVKSLSIIPRWCY